MASIFCLPVIVAAKPVKLFFPTVVDEKSCSSVRRFGAKFREFWMNPLGIMHYGACKPI
ncbi:hypothetical protein [Methylobacterium sp. CM6247]